MLLLESAAQSRNISRAKPDSKSGELANTTFNKNVQNYKLIFKWN